MSNVLVTGGAGFIGSHVAEELIKRNHQVVVLDDLSGGFMNNVVPEAQFVHGSINDHELINRLFEEHKFEYVFHLAAYAKNDKPGVLLGRLIRLCGGGRAHVACHARQHPGRTGGSLCLAL